MIFDHIFVEFKRGFTIVWKYKHSFGFNGKIWMYMHDKKAKQIPTIASII